MPDLRSAYKELVKWYSDASRMYYAIEILQTDAEMVMKPGSHDDRAAMVEVLAQQRAKVISDASVPDLLQQAEESIEEFSPEEQRDIQLMRRFWVHEACLPAELAGEYQRAKAEGESAHSRNYKSGDWETMYPYYKRAFELSARVGECKAEALNLDNPYDALVDFYSPGLSCEIIDPFFVRLNEGLTKILPIALERQKQPMPVNGPFSMEAQKALNQRLIEGLGLDQNRAVVYFSSDTHPFMAGPRDDTRLVTRMDEEDFLPAVFGSLHEAGHALYQQNLLPGFPYQAVAEHMGMAVHESQSMIIEYQASMSDSYIRFLAKSAREAFGRISDPAFSEENILVHMRRVEPSFIRIDSDEMTYSFHIMIRYELERRIFAGNLDVKDLPEAFNDLMEEKMGIRPESNATGCMQDVHWPGLLQGYFPAYTFGAATAAQFFKAATEKHPEIYQELEQGKFNTLREWLRLNVHGKGSLLGYEELMTEATGEPLNPEIYLAHLNHRYCG